MNEYCGMIDEGVKMVDQIDFHTNIRKLFEYLEGNWVGQGQGQFPTINNFDYRETMTFERRDDKTLSYVERTERRSVDQANFQPSHWENGFIRALDSGQLELVNVQSSGRSEVLTGTVEFAAIKTRMTFSSQVFANDERMVATTRTFEAEGDSIRYEMAMQTNKVDKLLSHISATLQRVK